MLFHHSNIHLSTSLQSWKRDTDIAHYCPDLSNFFAGAKHCPAATDYKCSPYNFQVFCLTIQPKLKSL